MGVKSLVRRIISDKTPETNEKMNSFVEGIKIDQFDKNHVWAFVAGQYSQDFRGNPKYLFAYVNNYRPDIFAYWLCSDEDTLEQVRSLGFRGYNIEEPETHYVMDKTGVIVGEQVKMVIPVGLEKTKYLNLWHGVGGVKPVERKLTDPRLIMEIAKKYIINNTYYRNNELYLAPSKFIEDIAMDQLGLPENRIIRAGYPRNTYQKKYDAITTFDHDLIAEKGLPADTRIAAYAPTYRSEGNSEFFTNAICDMDSLIEVCKKNHILMVFKMHPLLEQEAAFQYAKQKYADSEWLYFWDNRNDFYEVIDKVDLCIYDYSSMFTDFISVGVKNYLRYTFDFDNSDLDFPLDYDEATIGRRCKDFSELLAALSDYDKDDLSEGIEKIKKLYWEYDSDDNFDKIVDFTLDFVPDTKEYPTLYSFDIFDTLISRRVLDPVGIFYRIQEHILEDGSFPHALNRDYPEIRENAELVVREYYRRTIDLRKSENVEVTLIEIIDRIALIYNLSDEQKQKLYDWEIEAEINDAIPLPKQVELVKKLMAEGNEVILISDMYLPKDVIIKMLEMADPVLKDLPLFLSNEYGVLKTSKKLYVEVYKSFKPFYDFGRWVHYGDNRIADWSPAMNMGIQMRKIMPLEFNDIQEAMIEKLASYDGYLVAAMQARMCDELNTEKEKFVASYVALCMVPYIDWALRDAIKRGYQTLDFISRDGHPLKRIADVIIKEKNYKLKTKYIYASRRTWRIPSFVDEIDEDFWLSHGSFNDITNKEKLFGAMDITEEDFRKIFPTLEPDEINFEDVLERNNLIQVFKNSEDYRAYLMDRGAKEREIVGGYLLQEIDQSEKFAFVEYWGRGYTQDCMVKIWHAVTGKKTDVPYYYTRTVLPTIDHSIRYNFTTNALRQFYLEGFFANMPYKSIEKYEVKDGKIEPIINPIPYNEELFEAMQDILPEFARRYVNLPLLHPDDTNHRLYDFVLDYYSENLDNPELIEQVGTLVDSVSLYGDKRQFAPPFTMDILDKFQTEELYRSSMMVTSSITMSYTRSDEDVKERYREMYQIFPEDNVAGGVLLKEEEIVDSRKWKSKYEAALKSSTTFSAKYDKAVKDTEVKNSIIILSTGKKPTIDRLDFVRDELKKIDSYETELVLLGVDNGITDTSLAAKLASAKYVFITRPIAKICKVKFRPETKVIMIPANPYSLYNSGLSADYYLKWRKEYENLIANNDISVIQVPSEDQIDYYDKCYISKNTARFDLFGNYMTDCYFDEKFKADAKKRLYELFPEAKNKKIILYMPKVRKNLDCDDWYDFLDIEVLSKELGEKYVLVPWIKLDKKKSEVFNVLDIDGFSKNMAGKIGLRNLICISDIIVGDYNDTFFETPILRKPAYSTTKDIKRYLKARYFAMNANDIDDLIFCPVVKDSYDLVNQIRNVKEFDYSAMDRFREKNLKMCDGHSVDRIVEYIKDEINS